MAGLPISAAGRQGSGDAPPLPLTSNRPVYSRTQAVDPALTAYLRAMQQKRAQSQSAPLRIKWISLVSAGFDNYVAADNVYCHIGSSIYALRDADGKQIWEFPLKRLAYRPDQIVYLRTEPIYDHGTIYSAFNDQENQTGGKAYLYAIDVQGRLRWRYAPPSRLLASRGENTFYRSGAFFIRPATGPDHTVYDVADDGYLYAIRPDGHLRWRTFLGARYSTPSPPPLVTEAGIYDLTSYGLYKDPHTHLYMALTARDGRRRWRRSVLLNKDTSISDLISVGGKVFFTLRERGQLMCLTRKGEVKMVWQTGARVSDPVAGTNGVVYVGTADGFVCALRADGTLLWRRRVHGSVVDRPCPGPPGIVYVGTEDGWLQAIDASGHLKWSWRATDAPTDRSNGPRSAVGQPVLSGQTLFIPVFAPIPNIDGSTVTELLYALNVP